MRVVAVLLFVLLAVAAGPVAAQATGPDVSAAVSTLTGGQTSITEVGGAMIGLAAIGAVFGWVLARIV